MGLVEGLLSTGPTLSSLIQDGCLLRCSLDQLCCVPHDGAICQSVSLPSLDWTGQTRVIGNQCGLGQSTYKEVSANGPVSDFRKVSIRTLTFIDKGYHEKEMAGYTFTFCITQPVAKEVNTELAPMLIQFSSCNAHLKEKSLKRL